MPKPATKISAVIPERLRDWFYALIALPRYRWFGKADYCALLTQEERERLLKDGQPRPV